MSWSMFEDCGYLSIRRLLFFFLHILQKPESAVRALLFHSLLIETHERACKISAKNGYFHIASESSHINFSPEYLSKMGKWPTKYLVPNVALWLRIFQDKRQSFVFSLKFKALKHRVKCFKCECSQFHVLAVWLAASLNQASQETAVCVPVVFRVLAKQLKCHFKSKPAVSVTHRVCSSAVFIRFHNRAQIQLWKRSPCSSCSSCSTISHFIQTVTDVWNIFIFTCNRVIN